MTQQYLPFKYRYSYVGISKSRAHDTITYKVMLPGHFLLLVKPQPIMLLTLLSNSLNGEPLY